MYAAHVLATNNPFLTSTLPPLDLKINGHSHNSSSDATQLINDEKQFTYVFLCFPADAVVTVDDDISAGPT
jgi:hypothetical protein